MLKLYLLSVLALVVLVLPAFLRDGTTSKKDPKAWALLLVVLILAPVALPSVVLHKVRQSLQTPKGQGFNNSQTKASITTCSSR